METNDLAREAMAELAAKRKSRGVLSWQNSARWPGVLVLGGCVTAVVTSFQPWKAIQAYRAAQFAQANFTSDPSDKQDPNPGSGADGSRGDTSSEKSRVQKSDSQSTLTAAETANPDKDLLANRFRSPFAGSSARNADGSVRIADPELGPADDSFDNNPQAESPAEEREAEPQGEFRVAARPQSPAADDLLRWTRELADEYATLQNSADILQHRLDAVIADHRSGVHVIPSGVYKDAVSMADVLFAESAELLTSSKEVQSAANGKLVIQDDAAWLSDHQGRLKEVSRTLRNVQALVQAIEWQAKAEALKPAIPAIRDPNSTRPSSTLNPASPIERHAPVAPQTTLGPIA